MRMFIKNFRHLDWFDVFVFCSWVACGFLGGVAVDQVRAAFHQ